MKNIAKVVLFSVLSGGIAFNAMANSHGHHSHGHAEHTTESAEQQVISTKGVVEQIDTETKKVTITHEPIPSLGWPEMTMRFTYENPVMIEDIKVGDHVNLDFYQQGPLSMLTQINVAK